eukprot:CAMPEP_0202451146 /NCGR_PEP_ID=MMETSP1360-20130828/9642_1 /ASSEMBLY_ACC=CAM_ASM_000848 /TAXON_ID=515479 /ORGANISM="Licmophora paradoxa, Strain CCMP2313" /LENGTH=827 /DNA_ID=CAMNT_0049069645 /DNA_START=188 /DNA_END=2671 /DNA_ORIENTATION=+
MTNLNLLGSRFLLLLLPVLMAAADRESLRSKLRNRGLATTTTTTTTVDTLTCLVLIEDVQYQDDKSEERFVCMPVIDGNQSTKMYRLELPDYFLEVHKNDLSHAFVTIDNALLTDDGNVTYPENAYIRFHGLSRTIEAVDPDLLGETPGNGVFGKDAPVRGQSQQRRLLVVRVSTLDSEPSLGVNQLTNRIFDLGIPLSLRSQYMACSGEKLEFIPGDMAGNVLSAPGILEITLDTNVGTMTRKDLTELAIEKAKSLLGLDDLREQFDNVMLNHPPGSLENWAAYAFLDYYVSVYNDEWIGYISAVMHEVGHNIGFTHSNENGIYKDQTGYMGFSYRFQEWPSMCFNGAKNWQIGWFDDRNLDLTDVDLTSEAKVINIAAFVDYYLTNEGTYVGVKIGNIFLQYNRAKGPNFQTREKRNRLTVTLTTEDESELLAGLNPSSGSYTTSDGVKIHVCSKVQGTDDSPDYMVVSIGYMTTLCPTTSPTDSPIPSPSPSSAPTAPTNYPTESPAPSPSPSMFPTSIPTYSGVFGRAAPVEEDPTEQPTRAPTRSPTRSPTNAPSPSPTKQPTRSPSSSPTAMPSASPSRKPSAKPSKGPSAAPSYTLPDRGQICDDDPTGTFLLSDGTTLETCYWLNNQGSSIRSSYCNNAASEASTLCPETCGTCTDDCEDEANATFLLNGQDRTCSWLAGQPILWQFICIPGETAFEICKETCNSCMPYDPNCNDSTAETFFVNDDLGSKTCIWLADASRTEFRRDLCVPTNPAFHICSETCGKCYDNCFDDTTTKFQYKNHDNRDCGWLSIRTWEWDNACASSTISGLCQETCNSCTD